MKGKNFSFYVKLLKMTNFYLRSEWRCFFGHAIMLMTSWSYLKQGEIIFIRLLITIRRKLSPLPGYRDRKKLENN